MGWFLWKRKKHILKVEAKVIEAEISRSKRFGLQFGVLAVELSHIVPLGLSKILPGRTISYHVLQKNLRLYDQIIESHLMRRYYIILPQTNKHGLEAVKTRLYRIAEDEGWGDVLIRSAIYPDDGNTSRALLDKCSSNV
jgi:hypothetical protein